MILLVVADLLMMVVVVVLMVVVPVVPVLVQTLMQVQAPSVLLDQHYSGQEVRIHLTLHPGAGKVPAPLGRGCT